MDIEQDDPGFEDITRLIREEERTALEIFRRQEFRRRVMARVGEHPDRGRPRFFSWKLAIPVGAAALIFIAAWAVFFDRHAPVPGTGGGSGSFVTGLESALGSEGLTSRKGGPFPGEGPIVGAPRSIRDVLALAQQKRWNERESALPQPGVQQVPRLSLERKMAILFKEKAIERVLVLIRKKSEEA